MKLITTLTSMAAFSMLTATSQATIFWTFTQEGNDVRAAVSGSLATGSIPATGGISSTSDVFGALLSASDVNLSINRSSINNHINDSYFTFVNTPVIFPNFFNRNGSTISGWFTSYSTPTGVRVSWDGSLGTSLDAGESISAVATIQNTTLSAMGFSPNFGNRVLFAPTSNPADYGNSIVIQIPEPSSVALTGFGFLLLSFRRKR